MGRHDNSCCALTLTAAIDLSARQSHEADDEWCYLQCFAVLTSGPSTLLGNDVMELIQCNFDAVPQVDIAFDE
jgi:hypothetical protein